LQKSVFTLLSALSPAQTS